MQPINVCPFEGNTWCVSLLLKNKGTNKWINTSIFSRVVWWPNIESSACATEIYGHHNVWAPSCGDWEWVLSKAACVYTDAVHSLLKIKLDLLASLTQATHVADYTLGCWVNVLFKLCKRCTWTKSVLAIKQNTASSDERTGQSILCHPIIAGTLQ